MLDLLHALNLRLTLLRLLLDQRELLSAKAPNQNTSLIKSVLQIWPMGRETKILIMSQFWPKIG